MDSRDVCSECKFFINEDSFGSGWCELHQKKAFCENGACEGGEIKGRDFSLRTCGDCDAFCECGLGDGVKMDDAACQYFDDTSLSQLRQLNKYKNRK